MEALLTYLLNASAGLVLFYAVYWIFLRKETFHEANRWFLFLSLLVAALLPLFPLRYTVFVESGGETTFQTISDTFKNLPVTAGTLEKGTSLHWKDAILLIYLAGSIIFLLRLLLQTFSLIRLILKNKIKTEKGFRIIENEKYDLPFSFFNLVFINPKFYTQEDLPEILAHEKVHIRENHWFDLLFIELLTVIFWFNPFIWLFERSIKQNHEYLADKGVLAQGHTVARYQALLVNQLMGMQVIGITNNLNFALNKNRLKMMTKKKTPVIRRMKFVWAMPVLALLLFAFAEPQYSYTEAELVGNKIIPAKTQSEKQLTIHGKVVSKETGEVIPGASIVIKGTTFGTVSDHDGTFTLIDKNPTVKADGSLSSEVVVSFVGRKTIVNSISAAGSAVDNAKYTFKMEEAVQVIYNKSYNGDYKTSIDGERLAPPPPPTKEGVPANGKTPPPPPPPVKNGEEEVFYIVEDMPHYPDGYYAMQDYFSKMQQKISQAKGITGKAKVLFTINAKGKVSDIKVVEQDNDGAAEGAVALVSGMPDWKPGKQRGKAVPVKYLLPVEFK